MTGSNMSVFKDADDFVVETGILDHNRSASDEELLPQLRDIIASEVDELSEAIATDNPVEILDAMVDIVYATLSMAAHLLPPGAMEAAWDEVHASNMTKVGAPIVNGKLQKGDNYRAPDLRGALGKARYTIV